MAKEKSVIVTMTKERDTAKTVRFEEDAEKDDQKIGKLYVKKTTLKGLGDPENIEVTIAVV